MKTYCMECGIGCKSNPQHTHTFCSEKCRDIYLGRLHDAVSPKAIHIYNLDWWKIKINKLITGMAIK